MVTYSLVAPWWRTAAGRNLWAFAASITLILVLALYRILIGPLPATEYIRAFCYTIFAFAIWAAEVALVRVQILRRGATKDEIKRSEDPEA
jgi:hypothetical protein